MTTSCASNCSLVPLKLEQSYARQLIVKKSYKIIFEELVQHATLYAHQDLMMAYYWSRTDSKCKIFPGHGLQKSRRLSSASIHINIIVTPNYYYYFLSIVKTLKAPTLKKKKAETPNQCGKDRKRFVNFGIAIKPYKQRDRTYLLCQLINDSHDKERKANKYKLTHTFDTAQEEK